MTMIDNGPDCTSQAITSACSSDDANCYTTIETTSTTFVDTTSEIFYPPDTTITISSSSATASGFYPESSDSITPHTPPPPVPHSTRTANTATPATSGSSVSVVTSISSCIHWSPAPPAVTAFSESDSSILSTRTVSSSCVTLSWSGSIHSEHSLPPTPDTTLPATKSSTSEPSTSKTTFTSTTVTPGVGYPGPSSTSSGIQGTNFTGQGMRTQVTSAIVALVAVALLPFLLC